LGVLFTVLNFTFGLIETFGWGGRIRTYGTRYQKALPYRLATPQLLAGVRCSTALIKKKKQSISGLFIFDGQWAYKGTPSDLVAHIYNLGIPFKRSAAGF
jgi:hypothetical protein